MTKDNLPAYVGFFTQSGQGRSRNADRFRILTRKAPLIREAGRGELFAVFDGIGSKKLGGEAAETMCESLVNFFKHKDEYPCSIEGVKAVLEEGNRRIAGWGHDPGSGKKAGGCAGTVLWIIEESLVFFHVGDTSGVLIQGEEVHEATRPHQASDGALERFLGQGQDLQIDILEAELTDYDTIVLASDGVSSVLTLQDQASLVKDRPAGIAAKDLVHQAEAKGSRDDRTAVVIDLFEFE